MPGRDDWGRKPKSPEESRRSFQFLCFMKKLFFVQLLVLLHAATALAQQPINFSTTNLNQWTSTLLPNGAPQVPVPVGLCDDPCIIQCLCGTNYPLPQETNCNGQNATAIWGTGPIPGTCTYAPGDVLFRTAFDIPDCQRITGVNINLIADNHFIIAINGTIVTAGNVLPNNLNGNLGAVTDWSSNYNLTNTQVIRTGYNNNAPGNATVNYTNNLDIRTPFVTGQNVITVTVRNGANAPCLNYGFLSLCGTITTAPIQLDASFNATFGGVNGQQIVVNQYGLQGPNVEHQWILQSSNAQNGPWNTILGPVVNNSDPFTLPVTLQSGVFYRVVHRVREGNCTACCAVVLYFANQGLRESGTVSSSVPCGQIDCAGFRWQEPFLARPVIQPLGNAGNQFEQLDFFPSPADNTLHIRANTAIQHIKVYTQAGKLVVEKTTTGNELETEISTESLPAGIYLLQVKPVNGKMISKKVSIQH